MPLGIIRQRAIWTVKPPAGAGLNWSHPTTSGLMGYWLFNEGGGTQLVDVVGGRTMSWSGTGPFYTQGILGGSCGLFGGSNQNAVAPGYNSFSTFSGSISIALWFNLSGGSGNRILISRYADSVGKGYFLFWINSGALKFTCEDSAGNTCARSFSTSSPTTGVWYFAAVVLNAAAGTLNTYMNGALNNGTLVGPVISALGSTTTQLCIGNNYGGSGFWPGKLDNVMLWNRALQPSEIQLLYRQPFALIQPDIQYQGAGIGTAPPAQTGFPLFFGSSA